MIAQLAWLAFWGLAPGICLASWESHPEFQSLDETEQEELEGPDRLTDEYAGDILSYSRPARWEYDWLTQPTALDAVVGSTGAKQFYVDQRLKARKRLSEGFEFRFTQFQESDRERDSRHEILEGVFRPFEKAGFSLYGEVDHHKRSNDLGVSVLFFPSSHHEIRAFNTWVDLVRARRSDRNETYAPGREPRARGLVGRWWASPESGRSDFLEYAFRFETDTDWIRTSEGFRSRHRKKFASLFGNREWGPDSSSSLRLQYDVKNEERSRLTPASVAQESALRTERLLALGRTLLKGTWLRPVTLGVEYDFRAWEVDGEKVRMWNWIPHMLLSLPGYRADGRDDSWILGWIMNCAWARGPRRLRDPDSRDFSLQQKLNVSYEWHFAGRGRLSLMLTGDVDAIFSGRSRIWDGGQGALQLLF